MTTYFLVLLLGLLACTLGLRILYYKNPYWDTLGGILVLLGIWPVFLGGAALLCYLIEYLVGKVL